MQDMRLFKCWVSGTEKEIETEEVSWSYEREGEAPEFEPENDNKPDDNNKNPNEEMRRRFRKDAGEVKAKTTEQLAKGAPWLNQLNPKY